MVKKYRVEKTILSGNEGEANAITIASLLNQITVNDSSLNALMETEKAIVQSCTKFRGYLDLLKSFGGNTIFEFKADGVYKDGKLIGE